MKNSVCKPCPSTHTFAANTKQMAPRQLDQLLVTVTRLVQHIEKARSLRRTKRPRDKATRTLQLIDALYDGHNEQMKQDMPTWDVNEERYRSVQHELVSGYSELVLQDVYQYGAWQSEEVFRRLRKPIGREMDGYAVRESQ